MKVKDMPNGTIKGVNNMKEYINPNILNEGNQMELIQDSQNDMLKIVRCNNCGKLTPYGLTRMCSGFVGCDNKIEVDGEEIECYFDDLMPRVMEYHNSNNLKEYELYRTGKLYRWRDGKGGNVMKEKYDIVRGDRSGVFAGNILKREGKEVTLTNVRRLWYWDGACSISELALNGTAKPNNCKFTVTLEELTITDCIELIPCTDVAEKSIKGVKVWKY